jgi:hypothetical protein
MVSQLAGYQTAYEEDFEAQQQQDNPACSMTGLYQLLSFADAVDSTRPVLKACCAQLQSLKLHAQLGQTQLALETNGSGYYFIGEGPQLTCQADVSKFGEAVEGAPVATTAEERQAFKQQVAAQTEQLLWLAHKLQLQALLQHLSRLIRALTCFKPSLLRDAVDAVFTPRVLEAAGVAGLPGGKQMLLNEACGELLKFTDSNITGLTEQQRQPIQFEAVLPSTSLRIPPGTKVAVQLDLFGSSTIRLGVYQHAVQLRIGPRFRAP